MFLKSVSLYGFKTFALKTDFVLKPGLTAVVGPNGCGKSNLFDAVVWVLGEQSMRSLRGRKMEEVVFHGSEAKKPLGFAQVKLVFDNEDGFFPLPHSEISIVRRFYKSGDSEFEINGQPCRLRDIHNLLMDTGMGKLNYSIINQGDVEYIIGLSPTERRVIFDEAAGINKYKIEKRRTLNKIKDTDANIARLRDLLTDIEERLDPLSKQAEQARRYEDLVERIESLKRRVIVADIRRLLDVIDTQNQEEKTCRDNISKSEEDTRGNRRSRDDALSDLAKAHSALNTASQDMGRLRGKLENQQQTLDFLQNALRQNEQSRQRLEGDIQSWTTRHEELEKEIKELHKNKEEAQQRLEKQRKELRDMLSAGDDEAGEQDEQQLARQASEAAQSFESARDKLQSLREKQREINYQKQTVEKNLKEKQRELEYARGRRQSISEKHKAGDKDLEQARNALKDAEAQHDELTENAQKLSAERDNLSRELEDARENLAYERARAEHLQAVVRAAQSGETGPDQWVKLKSGDAPHALELNVKSGSEPAVRRALGALRDAAAVDASSDINELTPRQAGEMVFILADLLPAADEKNIKDLISDKDAVGAMSDFVQPAGASKAAAEKLFARFIVARDAAAVARLAQKAAPGMAVVSQQGDALFADGLLTLGQGLGGREDMEQLANEARENTKKIRSDIQSLEQQLGQLKNQIRQNESQLKQTQDRIRKQAQKETRIASDIASLEREMSFHDQGVEAAGQAASELEKSQADLETQIQETNSALSEAEKEFAQRREDRERRETRLNRVVEKRRERQDAIQSLRMKVNDLENEIRAMEDSAKYRDVERERAARRLEALRDDKQRITRDMRGRAQAVEDAREEWSGLSEQVAVAEKELSLRRDEIRMAQERVHQLERKIESAEENVDALREQMLQAQLKRERADAQLEEQRRVFQEEFPGLNEQKALDETENVEPGEKTEYRKLKTELEAMGPVNMLALGEYEEEKQRFDMLLNQVGDLEDTRATLMDMVHEFDDRSRDNFLETFTQINEKFRETFQEVFGGGDAQITLIDENDPLETGVEIAVALPGKRMRNIRLLSGGEKALCALTLIFSILKVKPSPFYMLDEVDAGLDDSNVDKFKNLLIKYSREVQFLVITHNKGTIIGADHYYGITMDGNEGYTRVLSVSVEQ